ncbi:MAG: tyrosine--tRNA ligase [Abditibacteriales bacterium]|nr:tyrosine--tRNA ligase [Abditibacteriales bacterium]MDW8366436.1 tyrosine--tRNA ligase [Abditibacteriales bacterium]
MPTCQPANVPTIEEQIALLRRGAAEIIPEDELRVKLEKAAQAGRPLRVKLGIDPTARDVTLGWAVVLRKLRQFQDLGHEACLIVGDFTAMIGDPSGKSKTRRQLSREEVQGYVEACTQQLFKILDRDKTRLFFNSDWLGKMTMHEVIHLCSKYTVARLLEREDFSKRLAEQKPLYVHEILYPLCQGYDSIAIQADVEMGGMDQKFNNLVGRELQREVGQEPQVVFLMPLLVGTDGEEKMSQSLGNYIGIAEPPFEMFSKVMSIPDKAMEQYFVLCTDVPLDEVQRVLQDPYAAKKRLAREIVTLYHSADAAQAAQEQWTHIFSQRKIEAEEAPTIEVQRQWLSEDGTSRLIEFIRLIGFAPSNSEARRLIQQKAVEINGNVIADINARIAPQDDMIVKVGKRRFGKVKIVG